MGKRRSARLIAPYLATHLAPCLIAALATIAATGAARAACSEDTVSVRGDFGSVQFTVAVADTNGERSRGLMFVEQMAPTQGMLFVYNRPQRVSFWMRNTLIPLDMVFVGVDGIIDNIHENAVPLDETPIFGGEDIRYVLEINGGMAALLGMEVGDEMQHPRFEDTAIWPCPIN